MEMIQREENRETLAMEELFSLMEECSKLDAEIQLCAGNLCFTAMVWQGWDSPDPEGRAKEIQTQIKELAKHYPRVACYCFDDHSTLLYAIC